MKGTLVDLFHNAKRPRQFIIWSTLILTLVFCLICSKSGATDDQITTAAFGAGIVLLLAQIVVYVVVYTEGAKARVKNVFQVSNRAVFRLAGSAIVVLLFAVAAPSMGGLIIKVRLNSVTKSSDRNSEAALKLSRDLANISAEPSVNDAVWNDVATLISYRSSDPSIKSMPPCGRSYQDSGIPAFGSNGVKIVERLHDCELQIDDPALPELYAKQTANLRATGEFSIPPDRIFVHFVLDRVRIRYSGGLIMASSIQMHDCTFDFKLNSTPSPDGRRIVATLLQAISMSNLDWIAVQAGGDGTKID